jgi:hypothetical protein
MTLGVSLASLLITFQLRAAGASASVLDAGRPLLARTVGNIMVGSGMIAVIAFVILLRGGASAAPVAARPAGS